uniref:Uncharacterized protein n=1 Tax=Oncorhynchus kisutch TaxID=8019 RepID=A0A8C7DEU4_ONCKI
MFTFLGKAKPCSLHSRVLTLSCPAACLFCSTRTHRLTPQQTPSNRQGSNSRLMKLSSNKQRISAQTVKYHLREAHLCAHHTQSLELAAVRHCN